MSFWDDLHHLLDRAPGTCSACVWQDRREVYAYAADAVHPAASLIKVPLSMAVWEAGQRRDGLDLAATVTLRDEDRVEGEGGFDQAAAGTARSYAELIGHALRESDNTAANALIAALGMEAVNAYIAARPLGLTATVLRRRFMDWTAARAGHENQTTARDMCRAFEVLLRDHDRFAPLIDALHASPYDGKLVAGVSTGTPVAHKAGDLPGVEHDAGIVYAPDGPYIVALLASGLPDEQTGVETLARASALIYGAMTSSRR